MERDISEDRKARVKRCRIGFGLAFAGCSAIFISSVVVVSLFYDAIWVTIAVVSFPFTLVSLVCFVLVLICVRFDTYSHNGYEISVYRGFLVTDLIVDKELKDRMRGSDSSFTLRAEAGEEIVEVKVGFCGYSLKIGDKVLH